MFIFLKHQMIAKFRENYLKWNEIEKLSPSTTILVNTNRLYWKLSELMRTKGRQNEIRILLKYISEIKNERSVYIPMKVKDVISCFDEQNVNLPLNTFKFKN